MIVEKGCPFSLTRIFFVSAIQVIAAIMCQGIKEVELIIRAAWGA